MLWKRRLKPSRSSRSGRFETSLAALVKIPTRLPVIVTEGSFPPFGARFFNWLELRFETAMPLPEFPLTLLKPIIVWRCAVNVDAVRVVADGDAVGRNADVVVINPVADSGRTRDGDAV